MNILHYSLGLPPYRSGGLTKYATDLMISQNNSGDKISLLFPGNYTFWKYPKIKIIPNGNFKGISVFQIQNPTIVPLLHGVKHPKSILNQKQTLSDEALRKFYYKLTPDIFHIHTLMGLPPELLTFFKQMGVKVIFTTHDYYGLCLKVNFVDYKGTLCNQPNEIKCAVCNGDAPSSLFLRLRNSIYLLKFKKILAHRARKLEKEIFLNQKEIYPSQRLTSEYSKLIEFYFNQFDKIDFFHFNSSVTKEVFEYHLGKRPSAILSISHSDITDRRRLRTIDKKHIRLGFIGSSAAYKGLPLLKEVLMELQKNGINNWSLQVWGGASGQDFACNQIVYKGVYAQNNIAQVYDQIDLLIVPSICKETFGFVAMEALSFGVPVLVSTNVGAKDIINNHNQYFIFQPSKDFLLEKIERLLSNPLILSECNKAIVSGAFDFSVEKHSQQIKQLYVKILK